MKRRLIATILALLVISFKGTAGFMDALSQKVNDAAKAIGGAVTGQETNENGNQVQNANENIDEESLAKLDNDALFKMAEEYYQKRKFNIAHKYYETIYQRLHNDYYNAKTMDELKNADEQMRQFWNRCPNSSNKSMKDLLDKSQKCLADFDKLREQLLEKERLAEKEAKFKAFKEIVDKLNPDELFQDLVGYAAPFFQSGEKENGEWYRNLHVTIRQENANYILEKTIESGNSFAKLYKLGLTLESKDNVAAEQQLASFLESKQGVEAMSFLDILISEYKTKHQNLNDNTNSFNIMFTKGFDFANKTVFDKYKDDPSFIFPNKDVCDSEIPLYKTYKSGMNKKCIAEENLTFSSEISVDDKSKNACFVSTANNYGNNRNPYKTDKTEVDFYFAHKNAIDPIGVLVQVCVTLRSSDVEFDDVVNKYSKQLGIESPNITQKVLKNEKLRNDLRMELGRYQIVEKTCILESNGLKVVVMAHDINVSFNDEAKELVNQSDRNIIITKLKMSIGNKAKTIVIVDTKQMEAYHQLYLKEKKAEEEREKQRKNESKNKQLDF